MFLYVYGLLSTAWAVEGLGATLQHPDSLQDLEAVWNISIAHRFWINPSVYSNNQWEVTDVSDVLVQEFSLHHRLTESISVHGDIPMLFLGSKELYRAGNGRIGTRYHLQTGSWNAALGLDVLSKGFGNSELTWSSRGLYPNLHVHKSGASWLMDIEMGMYLMPSAHSVVSAVFQQDKDSSLGFGLNAAWLEAATWSSMSLLWSRDLESISITTVYQLPIRQGLVPESSIFEIQIAYQPSKLKRETDRDGDGISNVNDFCTDEPEDVDGFEDDDGCPDPDNDRDGLADAVDDCPLFAEDVDGFEDDDGCPDPDNDMDNILDVVDRCPSQPETINQYQDVDGCPDQRMQPDFDGDGLWDDRDGCPFNAEDVDGFEDDDGCPDPDELPNWLKLLNNEPIDEEFTDEIP